MKYTNKVFKDQSVDLDGNEFDRCTFQGCEVKYYGGELPILNGCHFDNAPFVFEKGAGNTLAMLRGLYHGGLSQNVESLFEDLRRTPPS
jgi:hypothetical protein